MRVKIYHYKNCSTCKNALKFLNSKGIDAEVLDITATPPTMPELKAMLAHYDGNVKKLFNTSGEVYRQQKLGEKLADMTEGEALKLLAANGKLVKRPFLMTGGKAAAVGFKEDEWRELF